MVTVLLTSPVYSQREGIGLWCPRKLQFSRMRCPARRPALEVIASAHLGHSSANPPYHNLSRRMVWFVTGLPVRDMSGRRRQLLRTLKTAYTAALCARLPVPAAEPQVDIRRLPRV